MSDGWERAYALVNGPVCRDQSPQDRALSLEIILEDLRTEGAEKRDLETELIDRTDQFDDYITDLADHLGGVAGEKWKAWIASRTKSRRKPDQFDYWYDEEPKDQ